MKLYTFLTMTTDSKPSEERIKISDPHAVISIEDSAPFSTTVDIFDGSIKVAKATGIELPNDWDLIPPIHKSRGLGIEKSEDLVHIIELPLYKATRMLFDAGIQTTESNAHFEANEEETLILLGIRWSSLNENQKNMANKFCVEEPDRWVHLSAQQHPDNYEALYLNWKIKKSEVKPRQVKAYVEKKAAELIQGKLKIRLP
jgi:hypothetical protein